MNNKLILTFSILFYTITLTAQDNCYNDTRQSGIEAFNQGKYDDAIDHFTYALNVCEDLPSNHDLAGWIKKCRDKINNPPPKEVFTINGVSFEMIFVQGGTFTMGCTSEQSDCLDSESPTHRVTLSGYYIGKYQVTQKLWKAVMGSYPGELYNTRCDDCPVRCDDCPIGGVNWEDTQRFIRKLNTLTGKNFRLPAEAEWEYAARGGSQSKGYRYSGSNNIEEVAWYNGNYGDSKHGTLGTTYPVGTKMPNELGLYDMSGNVYEWCQDWKGAYSRSPSTNPKGPDSGSGRVLRGGSWYSYAQSCRVASRSDNYPGHRFHYNGFRLSLVPPKAATATPTPPVSRSTSVQPAPPKEVFTVNGVSFDMIFVQGGTFTMGCTSEQSDCLDSESPTHSVTLSGYYIGKYQVTQKLWQAVMGTTIRQQRNLTNTSWPFRGEGDDYPMYYINYNECEEFCSRLNKLLLGQLPEGYKFRLPTEAQWEYASRGGKKSKGYKYSGSDYIGEVAWYDGNSGFTTHEVGKKEKNELGIYDMSGNVWEWCLDWYGDYSSGSVTNPEGPVSGSGRVLRGGSWNHDAQNCRVAIRNPDYPDYRRIYYGFRLSLVP